MGFLSMLFGTPKLQVKTTYKTKKTQKHAQRKTKNPKPTKGTRTYYLEVVTESKRGLVLKRIKIIVPKSASSFGIYKVRDNRITLSGYSIPFKNIPEREWNHYLIRADITTKGFVVAARLLTNTGHVKETSRVLGVYDPKAFRKAKPTSHVRVVNLNAQHKSVHITI